MQPQNPYIYLHCKPDGTPFYVGKGSGKRAMLIKRKRSEWHSAIVNKYGAENILVYIFECESHEEALKQESAAILQLRKDGYELCNHLVVSDGGLSGFKHSEETKEKIRLSLIGNSRSKGKVTKARGRSVPEHLKVAHAIRMTGRKASEETKKKMSESHRGVSTWNKGVPAHNRGVPHTEDARRKMSEVRKGVPWSDARRAAQLARNGSAA